MSQPRALIACGLAALALLTASPPGAQEKVVQVLYVNGIQNTLPEAQATAILIENALMESPRNTGPGRKVFEVETSYNPIGWAENDDVDPLVLTQELRELFVQKASEELYLADLMRTRLPHDADAQIDVEAAKHVVSTHLLDMTPGVTSLEAEEVRFRIDDARMEPTRLAAVALAGAVRQRSGTVVVAHSQGNLLANLAWASLAAQYGNRVGQVARIVNVANTSAVSINGLSLTQRGDSALYSNGLMTANPSLEALPGTSGWTRRTPFTDRCGSPTCAFAMAEPTFRITQGAIDYPSCSRLTWLVKPGGCGSDLAEAWLLRHAMSATYLNAQADVVIEADPVSRQSGVAFSSGTRFVDRFVDLVFAAAQALERPGPPIIRDPAPDPGGNETPPVTPPAILTPDLAFASLGFSPATVSPSAAVNLTLAVLNRGTVDASASTAVVRINRSGASAADPVVSMDLPVPALAAGSSLALPLSTITAPATPGTYRIWVLLDNRRTSGQPTAAEVDDIVLATGTLTVTEPAGGGPDLVVRSVVPLAADATAPPGGKLSVLIVVANTGADAAAASKVAVRIVGSSTSPAGNDLTLVDVPALAAGASVSLDATVRVPTTVGAYRVWGLADVTDTAGQLAAARGNDAGIATRALTVVDAPQEAADLVASAIGFEPARVTQGGLVVVSLTIRNQGLLTSRSSQATVRLRPVGGGPPGADWGLIPVPQIAPGDSRRLTAALSAPVAVGRHQVWVELDSSGAAGQATAAAVANDTAAAPGELDVLARVIPAGASAEGVYGGSISGAAATAFRLLVLESGEFWALYGASSGGRFAINGFLQGVGTSASGRISVPDLRDFGVAPSARGSALANYDVNTGVINGSVTTSLSQATMTGGPLLNVAYEYQQAARLADVQGVWGLSTNTGDAMLAQVQADGRFETTSTAGCRLSGAISPRASGKNVFDVVVSFGAAPCVLMNQTARGIAVVSLERDGRQLLTIGLVDAARSVGLAASGVR